ncbi:DUF6461 domain-containing protein [Streptomyces sp. NRRL F-5193]|uniref:DUF6461 domain-containing protein n=1 Tax=Streptomyces sp. NRRL F-5193 TaxID=1463860 RepID=UPI003B63D676
MTEGYGWEWVTGLRFPIWCVTFTRDLLSSEVMRRYGADPRAAVTLAREEAGELYDLALAGGTVLRAGTLDGWAFAYEDVSHAGAQPGPLGALSRNTETLCLLRGGDGTNRLEYWREGGCREAFEVGVIGKVPQGEHNLWDLVQSAGRAVPPRAGLLTALQAISDYTGVSLSTKTIQGPLLSVYLSDEDRTPDPTPQRSEPEDRGTSGLRNSLGAVRPPLTP